MQAKHFTRIGFLALGLVAATGARVHAGWELYFLGEDPQRSFSDAQNSTELMEAFRSRFGARVPDIGELRSLRSQAGEWYRMQDDHLYAKVMTFPVEGHEVRIFRSEGGRVAVGVGTRPREWLLAQHKAYSKARAQGLSSGSAKLVQAFASRIYKDDVSTQDAAVEAFLAELKSRGLTDLQTDPSETSSDADYWNALRDRERVRRFQASLDSIPEDTDRWFESDEVEDLMGPARTALDEATAPLSDAEYDELSRKYEAGEEGPTFDEISWNPTPSQGGDLLGFGGLEF